MAVIGKLLVALGVDRSAYEEGLNDAAKDATGFGSKVTSALGGIGKVALGVGIGGITVLAGGIMDAISSASEAQEVFAQTEAVVKATGGAAGKSAQEMADLAGSLSAASGKSRFGDDAILQGENLLATFTNIKGATFDLATGAMVDLAQAMGTDVKGGAIQLGKALNDPIQGVSALSRVGVSFTDAQKAVIKSLQDTGDMAGAQKVILDELNKEFGGSAAAAAGTFAGKMDTLKDKFGELLESAGTKLLPFVTSFVDTLNSEAVQGAISGFIDLVSNGIGLAIEYIGPIIATIGTTISDLASYFQAVSEDGDTMNDFLANLPSFIQPVVLFITESLIPSISSLADWLITNIPIAIDTAVSVFNTVLLPIFKSFADLIFNHVIPALTPLVNWFIEQLPGAINTAIGIWNTILKPAVLWLVGFISTEMLPAIGDLVDWLAKNIPVAVAKASDFFNTNLLPIIKTVVNYIVTNVVPKIKEIYDWLYTNVPIAIKAASDIFNNQLMPAFRVVWGFISNTLIPILSTIIEDYIKIMTNVVRLLSEAWTNVLQPALKAAYDFFNANILPVLKKVSDAISVTLQPIIDEISRFIEKTFVPAWDSAGKAINPIAGAIDSVVSAIRTALDWIQKMIDKLDAIHIPPILQQQSPSMLEQSILDTGKAFKAASGASVEFNQSVSSVKAPTGGNNVSNASTVINIDARGAQAGVEEKIRQVVNEVLQKNVSAANLAIRLNNF